MSILFFNEIFAIFNSQFIHIMVGEYLAMDAYKLQKPWLVIDSRIKKGEFFSYARSELGSLQWSVFFKIPLLHSAT